jgi:3-isopropylmalate/(R)-2-methylmalate dehydratase small subunit
MNRSVRGKAYYCGDYVNTDLMAPGRFEPIEGEEQLARIALIDYQGAVPFVNPDKSRSDYSVIIAGKEFGCGSSRETAPQALSLAGAQVVIAQSFGNIFFRNCINMGLLMPIQVSHDFDESVQGEIVDVDFDACQFTVAGTSYTFRDFGPLLSIINAGGLIPYAIQQGGTS